MNTLYNVKNQALQLWNEVETEEEATALREAIDVAVKEQSEDIINVLKNMKVYAEALKEAEQEYKMKRQRIEEKYEKAKAYIKENMLALGYEKIETPLGSLSIRKSPASVEIIDESIIPEEFIKEEVVRKVDKNKILSAFRDGGEVIEGTRINTTNSTLMIK